MTKMVAESPACSVVGLPASGERGVHAGTKSSDAELGRCLLLLVVAAGLASVGRICQSTLATAPGKLRAKPTAGKNEVSNALARS